MGVFPEPEPPKDAPAAMKALRSPSWGISWASSRRNSDRSWVCLAARRTRILAMGPSSGVSSFSNCFSRLGSQPGMGVELPEGTWTLEEGAGRLEGVP